MRRWLVLVSGLLAATYLTDGHATPANKTVTRVVFDRKPGKTGGFTYAITDKATGKRMPAKLTFVGVAGTPSPRFSRGDVGRLEADGTGVAAINRVFSVDGTGVIPLPLGTYDVTISRGIEWTIATQRIAMTASGLELAAQLEHVVDTPKWASGDFHVHAEPSPDSSVPMHDRALEFVAEGVDLIVATDHNVVADYAPAIKQLGLGERLSSTPGDEISTGWGHFGAFPLPVVDRKVLPKISGVKPQAIFDAFRALGPNAIINVHHPRLEKLTGYFELGKFNAKTGNARRKDFSYDFDAVELLNGYEDTKLKLLDRNMTDWFALLDRGVVATATGNSDSHHMTYNLGGYPRNYVLVPDDAPGKVTGADMAKGIKAHRAFFTTGPIVDVHATSSSGPSGPSGPSAGIGDLARAVDGKAKLEILVRAAPWVSTSRVKLYLGGKLEKTWELAASDQVKRLETSYELVLPRDTHAVVRVEGDRPLTPVIGGAGSTKIYPVAVTNPILFDVDGNGRYDAPKQARTI
jgi:hypothetical protein